MILTVTLNPAIDKVYEVESFAIGDVFRPRGMWAGRWKGLNVSRVASISGSQGDGYWIPGRGTVNLYGPNFRSWESLTPLPR